MGARETLFGVSSPEETVEVGGQVVTVRGLTIGAVHGTKTREEESPIAALLRLSCFVDGEPLFKPEDDIDAMPTTPEINALVNAISRVTGSDVRAVEGN